MKRRYFLLFILVSKTVLGGGFETPGVGAKALSMGGAYVGLADDWTATFWNPAGLGQIKRTEIGQTIKFIHAHTLDGNSLANPFPPFTQGNIERGDSFLNLGGEPTHFNEMKSDMFIPIPAFGAVRRWGRWVGAFSLH